MPVLLLSFILSLFFSGDDLQNRVDDYLRKQLGTNVIYEFEIINIPDTYTRIEILTERNVNIQGGIAYIPVSVVRHNNRPAQTTLSVRLKIFKETVVSVSDIGRKEILNENLFELKMVDIAGIRGNPITTIENLNKFRSRVMINQSSILTSEMIEPVPEILVGDFITASVAKGNVVISLDAISRQEGISGDIISIKTLNDNRNFKARVIDSQNVLIIQ